MKSMLILSTLAGSILSSGSIHAADALDDMYFGIKLGKAYYDNGEPANFSDAWNSIALFGYEVTKSFAVEVEASTSSVRGDLSWVATDNYAKSTQGINWNLDMAGVYGVYRTSGDLYAKARAGLVYSEVSANVTTPFPVGGSEANLVAGFGGGWQVSDLLTLEAGYTFLNSDTSILAGGLNISY